MRTAELITVRKNLENLSLLDSKGHRGWTWKRSPTLGKIAGWNFPRPKKRTEERKWNGLHTPMFLLIFSFLTIDLPPQAAQRPPRHILEGPRVLFIFSMHSRTSSIPYKVFIWKKKIKRNNVIIIYYLKIIKLKSPQHVILK